MRMTIFSYIFWILGLIVYLYSLTPIYENLGIYGTKELALQGMALAFPLYFVLKFIDEKRKKEG